MRNKHIRSGGVSLIALLSTALLSHAATITVDSIASLQSAIDDADPGDRIIVTNGTYTTSDYITVTRAGTAGNRITIEAETILGAEITGTHAFMIESSALYVTIKGFHFTNKIQWGDHGANKIKAQFCRFTRNFFNNQGHPFGSNPESPYIGDMLSVDGDDAEIDHNEFSYFDPERGLQMIQVWTGTYRAWIHHNHFRDHLGPQGNGRETIKIGGGTVGLNSMHALVEHNLFERCKGEAETISNKSSDNIYRYNTFIACKGLTLRSGNDVKVYGNYFSNGSYIRFYGERHQFFSNYFKGGYINIGNGNPEDYLKVVDARIAFNTFIQPWSALRFDAGSNTLGAENVTIANNILYRTNGPVDDDDYPGVAWIQKPEQYVNPTWEGNILWNIGKAGGMPSSGYTEVDPKLTYDSARDVYQLQSDSPAIDAGVGSYPEVTFDMHGQTRDELPDVGADEYSSAQVVAQRLKASEFGPAANLVPEITVIQGGEKIPNGAAGDSVVVQQGIPSTQVFTITNNGEVSLSLTGTPAVSISGDAEISISSNISVAAATIAAGDSATFTLDFDTAVTGSYSATVSIANNDPDDDPYVFDVAMTVVPAALLISDNFDSGTAGDNIIDRAPDFNTTGGSPLWSHSESGNGSTGVIRDLGFDNQVLEVAISEGNGNEAFSFGALGTGIDFGQLSFDFRWTVLPTGGGGVFAPGFDTGASLKSNDVRGYLTRSNLELDKNEWATATLVFNTSGSTITYAGETESVPNDSMDVWVNGVRVQDNVSRRSGHNGSAFTWFGVRYFSSGAGGTMQFDNVELLDDITFSLATAVSFLSWTSSHFSGLQGGADDPLAQFDAIAHPGSLANGIFYLFNADPNSDLEVIRSRIPKIKANELSFHYPQEMPNGYVIHLEETRDLSVEGPWPIIHKPDGSGQWPGGFSTVDNGDGTMTLSMPIGATSGSFYRLVHSSE